MSSYNAILLRAQKAVKAYLDDQTFAWTDKDGAALTPVILRGVTDDTKTLPAIIVESNTADHEPVMRATGNWIATVSVRLRENADDTTEDSHLEHAGEVFDKLMTDTISDDLNEAAVGILTTQFVGPLSQNYSIVGRSWESELNLRLFCNGG